MTSPTPKTNQEKALDAFLAKKAEVDERLARLQALSDDGFELHPDEITWGNVGDLARYANLLEQITDIAFNEGEHAAPEPAEPKRTRMAPVLSNPISAMPASWTFLSSAMRLTISGTAIGPCPATR
jgi:hypothetical protein